MQNLTGGGKIVRFPGLNNVPKGKIEMKKDIHPEFRPVIFKDISCDFSYLTMSTVKTKETDKWTDGKDYPLVKFEVSSASHPFYTGKHRIVDAEGRAEKFKKKYARK